MAIQYNVQIVGLQKLIDDVQRAENLAKDYTKALSLSVDAYYKLASMRFYEGQSAWAPLSQRRIDERGTDRPILIDTRDLYNAATGSVGVGGSASVTVGDKITGWKQIGKTKAMMAVSGIKIGHQTGYPPNMNIPIREFWMYDDREKDAMFQPILDAWDHWIDNP